MTRVIRLAEDLTPEILDAAIEIHDGWYAESHTIDWEDLLYRLEEHCDVDLGDSMLTAPIKHIQKHIQIHRKTSR